MIMIMAIVGILFYDADIQNTCTAVQPMIRAADIGPSSSPLAHFGS